ncbi:MAG: ATP-binding protein [Bacteroidota bacterium]
MKEVVKIIQEISLLYELSLSVGTSLDLRSNCDRFLSVLISRKNLSFASVWLYESILGNTGSEDIVLIYANPENRLIERKISPDHPIAQFIKKDDITCLSQYDERFPLIIQEKGVKTGCYSVFKLGELGFLKLYTKRVPTANPKRQSAQLRNVIEQFTISLHACLSYRKLKDEETRRALMEKEVAQLNYEYIDLFEKMYDAFLILDENGMVIESNNAAKRLLGYEEDEPMNIYLKDIVHPDDMEKSKKYIKKLIEEGYYSDYEGRILTKDGEVRYLQVNSNAIYENGVFKGSRDIARDITARKKAEDELRRAKQSAEQAQIAEQQFLANMSHEIRTPMNAVVGMTHLLNETSLNSLQKEYVEALKFSSNSLMDIINNILDLSKIESGEIEFIQKEFDLYQLLKYLQQTFQIRVKDKPISVVLDIRQSFDYLLIGDATRLNQILTNLLGNASKFTENGTIGIRAEVVEQEGEEIQLQIIVHDTGIGIPSDKLDVIFHSFKQVESKLSRKYGGTGLGLAIVKQLVELQNGSIHAASSVGKGSEFIVTLPFKLSDVKVEEQQSFFNIETTNDWSLENARVLVVEDNMMNQKLISKILEKWNCSFDLATSGKEGVAYSQTLKYDAILMDVHMPEMDGCEASKQIRADQNNPNQEVPIIALTAAALTEERNRVFDAGMNDFLTKPFSPNSLKGVMMKWIETEKIGEAKNGHHEGLAPIDLSYLEELGDDDPDFVKEMIGAFLADIPASMESIQNAFSDRNQEQLYHLSHKLKPNLMIMGMNKEGKYCQIIETAANSDQCDWEMVKLNMDLLSKGIKENSVYLRAHLDVIT